MSDITDRTALIEELLSHVVSLRDHDDDHDTEMINVWETAADVMERAAEALIAQEATIRHEFTENVRITQKITEARDRWDRHEQVNTDLHRVCSELQQKITEQAAMIEAISVIEPEVIDTWGTMQFTPEQTNAIGIIIMGMKNTP